MTHGCCRAVISRKHPEPEHLQQRWGGVRLGVNPHPEWCGQGSCLLDSSANPDLSSCCQNGRFMGGLVNLSSEQEAPGRKGLRNRCKPDPGLVFQLCAAGREGGTRCSRSFSRMWDTKHTCTPLLLFPLDPSFKQDHGTALPWGHFNAAFQYLEGQSTTYKEELFWHPSPQGVQ